MSVGDKVLKNLFVIRNKNSYKSFGFNCLVFAPNTLKKLITPNFTLNGLVSFTTFFTYKLFLTCQTFFFHSESMSLRFFNALISIIANQSSHYEHVTDIISSL